MISEERPIPKFVRVMVTKHADDDEFGIDLVGILSPLNLGGTEIELISECINDDLTFDKIPNDSVTECVLELTGEWDQPGLWNAYWKIRHHEIMEMQ